MKPDFEISFEEHETAKAMFEAIGESYGTTSNTYSQLLIEKFNDSFMKEDENIVEHVKKMVIIAKELATLDNHIPDKMQVSTVINSLRNLWESVLQPTSNHHPTPPAAAADEQPPSHTSGRRRRRATTIPRLMLSLTLPPMESQEVESVQSINHRDENTEVEMIDGDNHEEEGAIPQESSKRKQTSEMWTHFKKVKVDDMQYAECNYCKTRIKAPPGFGTTSLFKHYRKACKRRPRGLDIRQSLIKTSKKVSGAEELTTHTFSQEYMRSELARMVILHDYPLSIVEHVGFRRYSASLQPAFTMISRNTLKNDIFSIYNDEKVKFYKSLDKVKCRVAITTDMWTASNNKKGFMAITAHFIDDSWRLQSSILRFIYVPAPHTADVLCDLLAGALMDWNIDRKVSTIMNLIVKDGLETISITIEKIRDNVVYWTASLARVEKFEEVARQLNVSCSKKLSLNCKTRWNSTYLMLETAIAYKDVFPRAKARDIQYRSLPTDEDWENAVEICSKLKLFYNVTEMFSGTFYPTSHFYFQKICEIEVKLDEWVKSTNVMIKYMAELMLEKYEKYWDSCHILMGIAAVLDPRVATNSKDTSSVGGSGKSGSMSSGTCSKFSGLESCPTMLDEEEDEETVVQTS
ncbi:hypothetical protein BUALT_Bualt05G0104800 [Buddleja alternifolia]|uniref:BED-type domain-containing protein n=1 Tax=Buddleja alternifolia TaxID=168488 RepID=A0AAV6XI74_9LAMI|nr:hypothetical protein BUALT_Bualt05G0104800 [Buddleja alternifolia]